MEESVAEGKEDGESFPLLMVGRVMHFVEGVCVVQGEHGKRAVDLKTLLVLADRTPLGLVADVFGNIHDPCYLVFPKDGPLDDTKIPINSEVFALQGHCDFAMDFMPADYDKSRTNLDQEVDEEEEDDLDQNSSDEEEAV